MNIVEILISIILFLFGLILAVFKWSVNRELKEFEGRSDRAFKEIQCCKKEIQELNEFKAAQSVTNKRLDEVIDTIKDIRITVHNMATKMGLDSS